MIAENFAVPNTLGVASYATYGAMLRTVEDVIAARAFCDAKRVAFIPVGQGSNIVPRTKVDGFIGAIAIEGMDVEHKRGGVELKVGAGELWHPFVTHCLQQGWNGLENLSLIPGTVGAAPIQNIGAYGVEVGQHITAVHAIDRQGRAVTFSHAECAFDYRQSIFRGSDEYVVTHVSLQLQADTSPVMTYPGVQQELERMAVTNPDAMDVAQAVINIRQAKLPDPASVPNVGSMFKNPVVTSAEAEKLEALVADLQVFPLADDLQPVGKVAQIEQVKLSAAQLIDHLGWKNKGTEGVACWQQQPLVCVYTGTNNGEDVIRFASAIQEDVLANLGVTLQMEPLVL